MSSLRMDSRRNTSIRQLGLGVSISALLSVVEELKEICPENKPVSVVTRRFPTPREVTWKTALTTDVCNLLVRPQTKGLHKSLAQHYADENKLVPSSQYPQDKVVAADLPTFFVCHAREYNFLEFVQSIQEFTETHEASELHPDGPLDVDQMFFWIDVFAVDQNGSVKHPHSWWKTTFQQAIADIGATVLVLQSWRDPAPLRRSWCLWEIYSTYVTRIAFHIHMSASGRAEFLDALTTHFDEILAVLGKIDTQAAGASPEDKQEIDQSVQQGIGFAELNQVVKAKLRSWLCIEAITKINSFENLDKQTVQTVATFQVRVGAILAALDKHKLAIRHLTQALKLLEQEHGSWETSTNADVVMCILELGDLMHRYRLHSGRAYLERVYAVAKSLEAEHPALWSTWLRACMALAQTHQLMGNRDEATKYFEEARKDISSNPLVVPSSEVSILCLVRYARFLRQQGLLNDSMFITNQAKAICEESQSHTPAYFDCLDSIATTTKNKAGKTQNPETRDSMHQEALKLFLDAYRGRKELLGETHWDTIKSVRHCAKMLLEMNHLDAAEQKCQEALDLVSKRQEQERESHRLTIEVPLARDTLGDMERLSSYNELDQIQDPDVQEEDDDDVMAVKTDIALAKAQILMRRGEFESALGFIIDVKNSYEIIAGSRSPKFWNALGELGYVEVATGDVEAGKLKMQQAMDGLIANGLSLEHRWVQKIVKRQENAVESQIKRSCDVVIVDCGANESKVILCSWVNDQPCVRDIGDKMPAIQTCLKDKRAYFVEEIQRRASSVGVETVYFGVTEGFRRAPVEEKQGILDVIRRAQEQASSWAVQSLLLTLEDEARYEVQAVNYATARCELPPTDVLIACGGASLQISTEITTLDIQTFGVETGFGDGRAWLQIEGLRALPELESQWTTTVENFKARNASFVVKPKANVMCISASYYAAVSAGISEQDISCDDARDRMQNAKVELVASLKARGGPLSSDDALVLSNLTIQIAVLQLVDPTSTIRFRRDWSFGDVSFRTTWTAGWFLKNFSPPK